MSRRQSGETLVGLLIVIAIIGVLAVAMMKGSAMFGNSQSPRKDGKGTTTYGLAKYAAKDVECQSNIGQVRMGLQIAATNADEKFPERLEETRLGDQFYKCPVGKEHYLYDPKTGRIQCPHPGHEKY